MANLEKFLMKKSLSIAITMGFVLLLVYPAFPKTIILIHSNDTHGVFKPYEIPFKDGKRMVGGMEATSHYINQVRATEKNVLLIDTGDLLTGTVAAEVEYQGVIGGMMIEFLNRLGYDVWAYGNHEFDMGQVNALMLARLAKFPTVMANIVYNENGRHFPVDPYRILEVDGLKVGVIAVMEENFLTEVHTSCTEGLDLLPTIPALKTYIPVLDRQSDLILVIAHAPFDEALGIAENVEGIDVILVASEQGKFKEVDGVLVKSTFGHQRTLGYLKLEVDDDEVVSYEEDLIWLWADGDLESSAEVSEWVRKVDASIEEEFEVVLGEAKVDLYRKNYSRQASPVEVALGNWIVDAMRWKTEAQIGFHNSGGIRADIVAGPVTKSDIFNVCPFRNTLVVFKLTGQQIKDALELDVERGRDRLQVSGLKYEYFPKEAKPYGQRIHNVEINGEILVKEGKVFFPEKVYSVVSNDYVVGHAESKYFGSSVADVEDTGLLVNRVLMEWLDEHKVLDQKPEDRIVEIKKPS